MAKKFKIVVPKAGAANELGTEARLYTKDEIVETGEAWQESLMDTFVNNGWAIETKEEVISDVEEAEPVRARNDKGHYIADDPSTPDVNEAYEGGVAPEKKTTKKTTAKKTTKKKA
jgi:hypothetical protein